MFNVSHLRVQIRNRTCSRMCYASSASSNTSISYARAKEQTKPCNLEIWTSYDLIFQMLIMRCKMQDVRWYSNYKVIIPPRSSREIWVDRFQKGFHYHRNQKSKKDKVKAYFI